jgi:hypothetical protein
VFFAVVPQPQIADADRGGDVQAGPEIFGERLAAPQEHDGGDRHEGNQPGQQAFGLGLGDLVDGLFQLGDGGRHLADLHGRVGHGLADVLHVDERNRRLAMCAVELFRSDGLRGVNGRVHDLCRRVFDGRCDVHRHARDVLGLRAGRQRQRAGHGLRHLLGQLVELASRARRRGRVLGALRRYRAVSPHSDVADVHFSVLAVLLHHVDDHARVHARGTPLYRLVDGGAHRRNIIVDEVFGSGATHRVYVIAPVSYVLKIERAHAIYIHNGVLL